ncbi:MAG: hypothetical protein QOJ73_352 [Streptosporangiaceae bacterium]|nr:hypothetical protein [Streptosporangiaceae bacterium]
MPADPQHPGSPGSTPQPGRWADWDGQEDVLAEELAAFPPEDEPDWESLEDAEYSSDASDDEPWPAGPPGGADPGRQPWPPSQPGLHPGGHPAGTATAGDHAAATPSVPGVPDAGSGFAHGGAADVMPPGPQLAALTDQAWSDGLDGLDDDELAGVLAAWARLGARAAAGQFAAISTIAARREAEAQASGDWRPYQHVQDEIAITLTLTRPAAARVRDLAFSLDRLPLTRAALAAGAIDERRAAVIADEISGLDDEQAAAVEALIITKAATQTTGQLRPAVHRAVIAADPSAAKRRKEEALKGARVETSRDPSGTACLTGRDLPPAEVLAADKHLTALARAMKKAGAEGTMDQLRARAYLHLLGGGTPHTLLALPPARTSTPGDGTPRGETSGTPGNGTPGTGGNGTPDTHAPGDGTPGDATPGDATPGDGSPGDRGPDDGGPGTGTASQRATRTGTPGPGPGPGLPTLRGTVNLTMPLAAWLGWTQSPGQVPGFGILDAEDSRALAAMLARDPATKWCLTLTDSAGHAIAHGCAKHGPPPDPRDDSGPDPGPDHGPEPRAGPSLDPGPDHGPEPRAGPSLDPGPDHGSGPRAGPSLDPGPDHGSGSRAGPGPGPPGNIGWLRTVKIEPLQTGTCTHPRETRGYQPSRALRHLIEIRQATCGRPGCRRAATACDLDHSIPYHLGGRTCECDLGPVCRHDHHLKQAPGWTLTQTQPGHMTWTAPSGRTYTTGPTIYPD